MVDIQKRRMAHYSGSEHPEETNKKTGFSIFVRTFLCMALIFTVAFHGNISLQPYGTLHDFCIKAISTDTDFSLYFTSLRKKVAEKTRAVSLKLPDNITVFNEENPPEQTNTAHD